VEVAEFPAHAAPCISIAQTAAGGRALLAVGCNDASVSIWDVGSMAVVRTLTHPDRPVHDVSWSCDGRYLALESTQSGSLAQWSALDIAVLHADDGAFGPSRLHRCAAALAAHACAHMPPHAAHVRRPGDAAAMHGCGPDSCGMHAGLTLCPRARAWR
jgi:hypothetical protein